MLLADVPADPFTPWITLILQGGGFALVVYIVAYVYPKASKEVRDEREKRDAVFAGIISDLQERFEKRNVLMVDAIHEQTGTMVEQTQCLQSIVATGKAAKHASAEHLKLQKEEMVQLDKLATESGIQTALLEGQKEWAKGVAVKLEAVGKEVARKLEEGK